MCSIVITNGSSKVALPKAEANEMGSFTDELDQIRLKNNSLRKSTIDSDLA
jgi:hypothetical protein